jgi:hypothetical protein
MTRATARPPGCFFVVFLVIGLVGTAVFGHLLVWLPLRARFVYVQADCVVLDKRLDESRGEDGPTYRPLVHIEYEAEGRPRRAWTYDAAGMFTSGRARQQAVLDRFQKGQRYPCWYDPSDPDRAVLTREFSLWGLMVLIPLAFVAFGASGLVYNWRAGPDPQPDRPAPGLTAAEAGPVIGTLGLFFGGFLAAGAVSMALLFTFANKAPAWLFFAMFFGPFLAYFGALVFFGGRFVARMKRAMPSPERAAAQLLPRPEAAVGEADPWPTVPKSPTLQPGRELTYRLTSSDSPGCFLLGALGVALFWNGIVSVFLYHMINGHLRGRPDWCLTVFLVPFVLVGLGMIVAVVAALVGFVTSLLAGSLRVEIAGHPLVPGGSYGYLVEQSGLVPLGNVRLTLKCTESATYTAGTSTSTATKEVYRAGVAGPAPSLDGGLRGTLTVPAEAMHSFDGKHNKISWSLQVSGRLLGILPHSQEYPVILLPAGGGPSP